MKRTVEMTQPSENKNWLRKTAGHPLAWIIFVLCNELRRCAGERESILQCSWALTLKQLRFHALAFSLRRTSVLSSSLHFAVHWRDRKHRESQYSHQDLHQLSENAKKHSSFRISVTSMSGHWMRRVANQYDASERRRDEWSDRTLWTCRKELLIASAILGRYREKAWNHTPFGPRILAGEVFCTINASSGWSKYCWTFPATNARIWSPFGLRIRSSTSGETSLKKEYKWAYDQMT